MELNPIKWFSRRAQVTGSGRKDPPGANVTARQSQRMGPYTQLFEEWIAREVNPRLYEALRESVPVLDGAINRYVMLDGIIGVGGRQVPGEDKRVVDGQNERVVRAVQDFMDTVRVGDRQYGYQAFYAMSGNELYEQGHALAEYRLNTAGNAVVQLLVADSKGVHFRRAENGELQTWYRPPYRAVSRGDASLSIERILRNDYRNNVTELLQSWNYKKLDDARLVHMLHNAESDNPYGTSLLRSVEFVSQVLLTITNTVRQTWERFGDPVFHLNYGTNARIAPEELEKRRKTFADLLSSALKIKAAGNSADMVTATGKDDTLDIKIIGADGAVLELEWPNRHVIEQMLSKLDLPSWLLGFHFSTAERLAQKQCELLLQASRTRFALRKPALRKPIEAHLRAQGITWEKGDWDLVQDLPNVADLVAKAQAGFLEAQTQLMISDAGGRGAATDDGAAEPAKVTRNGRVLVPTDEHYPPRQGKRGKRQHRHVHKESFVEDDEELPRLEAATEAALVAAWLALRDKVITTAPGTAAVFRFDVQSLDDLLRFADEYIATHGGADSVLVRNVFAAWSRGLVNASTEIGRDVVDDAVREARRVAIARNQLDLVRAAVVRDYQQDIVQRLMDGAYDGMNPDDVARALRERFGAAEYNWRRLARTEISNAQVLGKLGQYAEAGIEQYRWITAPDACPVCVSLAVNSPYLVGLGPTPRMDAHPECRCTVAAVLEDDDA